MQPTGLFWTSDHCSKFGGYVCKRKSQDNLELNFENQTIISTESFGTLTSPSKRFSYRSLLQLIPRCTIITLLCYNMNIDEPFATIFLLLFATHIQIIQIYIQPIQITM